MKWSYRLLPWNLKVFIYCWFVLNIKFKIKSYFVKPPCDSTCLYTASWFHFSSTLCTWPHGNLYFDLRLALLVFLFSVSVTLLFCVLACKRKEQEQHKDRNLAPKKQRLVFTDLQRRTLIAIFKENKRPSKEMQITISQQLGLELSTVSNFFMNARRRCVDRWHEEPSTSPGQPGTSATTFSKAWTSIQCHTLKPARLGMADTGYLCCWTPDAREWW